MGSTSLWSLGLIEPESQLSHLGLFKFWLPYTTRDQQDENSVTVPFSPLKFYYTTLVALHYAKKHHNCQKEGE